MSFRIYSLQPRTCLAQHVNEGESKKRNDLLVTG